jgi:hypothetical protein
MIKLKPKTLPHNTSGMAGVFWVASELARRNWYAFPTVRNQKGVDIIAAKEAPRRTKFLEVQVKTTQSYGATFWLLGTNDRNKIPHRDSLFFVFVKPESKSSPEFSAWVVSSKEVHKKAHHSPHGKFALCWWCKGSEKYRDRWESLEGVGRT